MIFFKTTKIAKVFKKRIKSNGTFDKKEHFLSEVRN